MKNLLNQISEIVKKHEKFAEQTGNNFNIFNVINVTTNEVRLHSKFISELLNINGTHGQRDLFLKLFIERFKIKMDTNSAKIEIEKHIGKKTDKKGGILDIYVYDDKGNSFTIENKIYASDQENQILRYYNYNNSNVFYLTLFGNEPSEESYGELVINEHFKLISYDVDITEWLIDCRKEAVELPLLREGISHYINLIKILTGKSNNHKMNKEIVNLITSSSEKLKSAAFIEKLMDDAKIEIQWRFWQKLKEKLLENDLEIIENSCLTLEQVISYYKKKRNREKYYGLWFKIYEKDNVNINFGIQIEDQIYYGFAITRNGKEDDALNKINQNYRNIITEINNNYETNKWWLGWRYIETDLNFRIFNSQVIELADEQKLNEDIKKIVENILYDIEIFKSKINEK